MQVYLGHTTECPRSLVHIHIVSILYVQEGVSNLLYKMDHYFQDSQYNNNFLIFHLLYCLSKKYSYPFYIVTHYIKFVTPSWTHSAIKIKTKLIGHKIIKKYKYMT